uniref:Uncharacterized protein n=1 Tax=Chromera velia CCMP2878 TaxID=1169474 RepID=A0A0G4HHT3_9ALVE|eukprot:Cvel_6860.t1-p1 / transcript=Cvel_6860.t1 / gene=Cvel_6860 / organism=Chromera_velia_CCMP2878 / gene_product=hypothetical protein / transcript_product=hypothetical protein / location=Cvel_scaffold346:54981-68231(+) / protein_length=1380 / sequence_SO=supercontig / SO=protein_coding / is_pseudo=false
MFLLSSPSREGMRQVVQIDSHSPSPPVSSPLSLPGAHYGQAPRSQSSFQWAGRGTGRDGGALERGDGAKTLEGLDRCSGVELQGNLSFETLEVRQMEGTVTNLTRRAGGRFLVATFADGGTSTFVVEGEKAFLVSRGTRGGPLKEGSSDFVPTGGPGRVHADAKFCCAGPSDAMRCLVLHEEIGCGREESLFLSGGSAPLLSLESPLPPLLKVSRSLGGWKEEGRERASADSAIRSLFHLPEPSEVSTSKASRPRPLSLVDPLSDWSGSSPFFLRWSRRMETASRSPLFSVDSEGKFDFTVAGALRLFSGHLLSGLPQSLAENEHCMALDSSPPSPPSEDAPSSSKSFGGDGGGVMEESEGQPEGNGRGRKRSRDPCQRGEESTGPAPQAEAQEGKCTAACEGLELPLSSSQGDGTCPRGVPGESLGSLGGEGAGSINRGGGAEGSLRENRKRQKETAWSLRRIQTNEASLPDDGNFRVIAAAISPNSCRGFLSGVTEGEQEGPCIFAAAIVEHERGGAKEAQRGNETKEDLTGREGPAGPCCSGERKEEGASGGGQEGDRETLLVLRDLSWAVGAIPSLWPLAFLPERIETIGSFLQETQAAASQSLRIGTLMLKAKMKNLAGFVEEKAARRRRGREGKRGGRERAEEGELMEEEGEGDVDMDAGRGTEDNPSSSSRAVPTKAHRSHEDRDVEENDDDEESDDDSDTYSETSFLVGESDRGSEGGASSDADDATEDGDGEGDEEELSALRELTGATASVDLSVNAAANRAVLRQWRRVALLKAPTRTLKRLLSENLGFPANVAKMRRDVATALDALLEATTNRVLPACLRVSVLLSATRGALEDLHWRCRRTGSQRDAIDEALKCLESLEATVELVRAAAESLRDEAAESRTFFSTLLRLLLFLYVSGGYANKAIVADMIRRGDRALSLDTLEPPSGPDLARFLQSIQKGINLGFAHVEFLLIKPPAGLDAGIRQSLRVAPENNLHASICRLNELTKDLRSAIGRAVECACFHGGPLPLAVVRLPHEELKGCGFALDMGFFLGEGGDRGSEVEVKLAWYRRRESERVHGCQSSVKPRMASPSQGPASSTSPEGDGEAEGREVSCCALRFRPCKGSEKAAASGLEGGMDEGLRSEYAWDVRGAFSSSFGDRGVSVRTSSMNPVRLRDDAAAPSIFSRGARKASVRARGGAGVEEKENIERDCRQMRGRGGDEDTVPPMQWSVVGSTQPSSSVMKWVYEDLVLLEARPGCGGQPSGQEDTESPPFRLFRSSRPLERSQGPPLASTASMERETGGAMQQPSGVDGSILPVCTELGGGADEDFMGRDSRETLTRHRSVALSSSKGGSPTARLTSSLSSLSFLGVDLASRVSSSSVRTLQRSPH